MSQFITLITNGLLPADGNISIISCLGLSRQVNVPIPTVEPSSDAWALLERRIGNNDPTYSVEVYSKNSEYIATLGPRTSMAIVYQPSAQRWWLG